MRLLEEYATFIGGAINITRIAELGVDYISTSAMVTRSHWLDIAILNESWKYKAYNKGLKPLVSPQMT